MKLLKCAFNYPQIWIRRRNLPPVLLLILLIFLILLTLIQILVVHNGHYNHLRNSYKMKKLHREMQELDINIRRLLAKDVPSMNKFRELLQFEINARKVEDIFKEAEDHNQLLTYSFSKLFASRTISHRSLRNSTNDTKSASLQSLIDYQSLRKHLSLVQQDYYTKHDLPLCQAVPRFLKGPMNVSVNLANITESSMQETLANTVSVFPGGSWRPSDCLARHRVAVIVPYRDRMVHLLLFLSYLHPLLQRQELEYRIFVVEQTGNLTFNKARLMNAGFLEAMKLDDFHCFVFHDVDLIPEDDRNVYSCPRQPRHLSVAIDEMNYQLAYKELVGGVFNVRREHFLMVNGYSNLYWGWGAEDDDMAYRITFVGLRITRPPGRVARYKMIRHIKRVPSDAMKRLKLLYTGLRRYQVDGLNSLKYDLLHVSQEPYYTHVLLDIGEPPLNLW